MPGAKPGIASPGNPREVPTGKGTGPRSKCGA